MQEQYVTLQTLQSFGIQVDDAAATSLLEHINDTVEERIGAEITESLSDDQLKELLAIQETGTEDQVGEWIAKHVPNYAEIVEDNIAIVVGEVAENASGINQA
jgi:hypothetical protein